MQNRFAIGEVVFVTLRGGTLGAVVMCAILAVMCDRKGRYFYDYVGRGENEWAPEALLSGEFPFATRPAPATEVAAVRKLKGKR